MATITMVTVVNVVAYGGRNSAFTISFENVSPCFRGDSVVFGGMQCTFYSLLLGFYTKDLLAYIRQVYKKSMKKRMKKSSTYGDDDVPKG